MTLKIGKRALANGRSGTRELPRTQKRSPNPLCRGVTSDDTPLLGPFREIFLGRRYSGAATVKSKSCQAFLQAYIADPSPRVILPFGDPFPRPSSSSTSTDRVLQPVRACVFYFYLSPDFIPLRRTRSDEVD